MLEKQTDRAHLLSATLGASLGSWRTPTTRTLLGGIIALGLVGPATAQDFEILTGQVVTTPQGGGADNVIGIVRGLGLIDVGIDNDAIDADDFLDLTIDELGLVTADFSGGNDAIGADKQATIDINGFVTATKDGINLGDGLIDGHSIFIGASGTLLGDDEGIQAEGRTSIGNSGRVEGGDNGLQVEGPGQTTVTNFGSFLGIGDSGMSIEDEGLIVNFAGGTIEGRGDDGIDVDGVLILSNFGTISASGGVGPLDSSEGVTLGGGTVTNRGTIIGSDNGIYYSVSASVPSPTQVQDSALVNDGTIEGTAGVGVQFFGNFNDTVTQEGGRITGGGGIALLMAGGNDQVTIEGGVIEGDIAGGTGTDTLDFSPASTFSFDDDILEFETINFNSGTTTLNGTTTATTTQINSGATLVITPGSAYNADGDFTVDGGTFNRTGGNFTLAAGQTLMASDGGQVILNGGVSLNDSKTLLVQTGADFTNTNFLHIGTAGDGTLTVRGSGSSVMTNTAVSSSLIWGTSGGGAQVNITDNASLTIGSNAAIFLAATGNSATQADVTVSGGASLTVNGLTAASVVNGGSVKMVVSGPGSLIQQTGVSPFTLGAAGGSNAAFLFVEDGGVFRSGTGAITINQTGQVLIESGGGFVANGGVELIGGELKALGGTFALASGRSLTALDAALVQFGGAYAINKDTKFTIASGSSLRTTGQLDIGGGSDGTLVVQDGAQVISNTASSATMNWGIEKGAADVTVSGGSIVVGSNALLRLGDDSKQDSAGSITVQVGASGGGQFSAHSVRIGTTDGGGTGSIVVTGAGSSFIQGGSATLQLGAAIGPSASSTIDVKDSALFQTGTGTTVIHATGRVGLLSQGDFLARGFVQVNGGQIDIGAGSDFTAVDGMTLSGGSLKRSDTRPLGEDGFRVGSGATFHATNKAEVFFRGQFSLANEQTYRFTNGADFTFSDYVDTRTVQGIGLNSNGTLQAQHAGTLIDLGDTGGYFGIGSGKATGLLQLTDNAQTVIGSAVLGIADQGTTDATEGFVVVSSGAMLQTQSIHLGSTAGSSGRGRIDVSGNNTELTQASSSELLIGNNNKVAVNDFSINVTDQAVFTAGQQVVLNASGALHVEDSATFLGRGDLIVKGGLISRTITGSRPGLFQIDQVVDINGGQLQITTQPGVSISEGDRFTVLEAGMLQGAFDDISGLDINDQLRWDLSQTRDGIYLTAVMIQVLGDLNGDSAFTNADIAPFVQALNDPTGYTNAFPGLDADRLGDFNDDGSLTHADIAGFVAALTGGGASPVPEPGSLALLGMGGLVVSRRRPAR